MRVSIFLATTLYVLVHGNKVFSKPSLLKVEQTMFQTTAPRPVSASPSKQSLPFLPVGPLQLLLKLGGRQCPGLSPITVCL